jgi:hypothetical protein
MSDPMFVDSPDRVSPAVASFVRDSLVELRQAGRRPPLGGVRLVVRRWDDGLGPNIAEGVLDVSAEGLRVILPIEPTHSDLFEVTLWDPDGVQRGHVLAGVRWWRCERDGLVIAGLVFGRSLSRADLDALSGQLASPPHQSTIDPNSVGPDVTVQSRE